MSTLLHLSHILHVLQHKLATGQQIYQVLRTVPLWDSRASLTSPVSIWLFPVSTDNSSRRSRRAFARPPSAACINRDSSAPQTLCPADQSNSISSHHATSLSLRHPYKEAFAGIFEKKSHNSSRAEASCKSADPTRASRFNQDALPTAPSWHLHR